VQFKWGVIKYCTLTHQHNTTRLQDSNIEMLSEINKTIKSFNENDVEFVLIRS